MNLKKTLGFTLFLLIFLSNCSISNDSDDSTNNNLVIYQEGNTTITLLNVEDSRCPTNVNCVWQGNGSVEMRIDKDNETENFTLNTLGELNGGINYPTSTIVLDLNIELIDLEPYPDGNTSYSLQDYTVILEVTD